MCDLEAKRVPKSGSCVSGSLALPATSRQEAAGGEEYVCVGNF